MPRLIGKNAKRDPRKFLREDLGWITNEGPKGATFGHKKLIVHYCFLALHNMYVCLSKSSACQWSELFAWGQSKRADPAKCRDLALGLRSILRQTKTGADQQETSITQCDFFRPKICQTKQNFIGSHDVLEPLKQTFLASCDVIISGQICGSKLQRVFTLGDGCWLPSLATGAWPNQNSEEGKCGVPSTGASCLVSGTRRDEFQSVPSPGTSSLKQGFCSSHYLRDLSQVVGRTLWETPVPFYTRTSQRLQKGLGEKGFKSFLNQIPHKQNPVKLRLKSGTRRIPTGLKRPKFGYNLVKFSELQAHPNLHSPVWVGQTAVTPSKKAQIWVFLYAWSCPGVALQIWVCLICIISTSSNGAVQILVGLPASFAIPAAIHRSAQGSGQESAPKSAFGVLLGTWLGVPQRMLRRVLMAISGPKKGQVKSALCPKTGQKHCSTAKALFGHFGPWALL